MSHSHSSTPSTSSSSSSDNGASTSGRMEASQMNMVFFSGTSTPLYSNSWTPSSTRAYAGTCIFLIVLAIMFRLSFALKHTLEKRWIHKAVARRYVVVAGQKPLSEQMQSASESTTAILTTNGKEEDVKIVQRRTGQIQPWRFSVDLPRAILVTVMAGMAYLLMVAVMTMNVGYFLSILGGTFVAELAFARYAQVGGAPLR